MKAVLTTAFVALFIASAALPASAADQQEKKVRKVVKIERHIHGAWLGVALRDVTEDLAKEKKLTVKEGALVSEVVDESPADSVGIKDDDIIVEVGGKAVASAEEVIKRVSEMKTGETAAVVVVRDGVKKTFSVKLGERPAMADRMEMRMPAMPQMPMSHMRHTPPMMDLQMNAGVEGMKLMVLTDQLGKYFDAPDNKALLVTNVKKNSNARKAGIEAGDVIIKVGKTDIEDLSDLHAALKEAKEGSSVDVQLIRKGARKTVKLEISKKEDVSMEFHGMFPHPESFNFEDFGFDRQQFHDQFRDMMRDLKPQMDKIRKHVRIRIHDGKVTHEETEEPEEAEESGTEL